MYPDAKFVLNVRPMRAWLISRYKHGGEHGWRKKWCWPPSFEKTRDWIYERDETHRNIVSYFLNYPDSLVIFNIEEPGWESIFARHLGKTWPSDISIEKNVRSMKDPKKKPDESRLKLIENVVDETLKILGYDPEETMYVGHKPKIEKFHRS